MKLPIGFIHIHFVHWSQIPNSTVNQLDIDSINSLVFCNDCLMTKFAPYSTLDCILYDVESITFSLLSICYKKKWIDQGYFNVINHRIWDRIDKSLLLITWYRLNQFTCFFVTVVWGQNYTSFDIAYYSMSKT